MVILGPADLKRSKTQGEDESDISMKQLSHRFPLSGFEWNAARFKTLDAEQTIMGFGKPIKPGGGKNRKKSTENGEIYSDEINKMKGGVKA